MPLDDAPRADNSSDVDTEVPIRCARCGHALTTRKMRLQLDGAHAHTFVNPSGVVYDIVLFREAPGTAAHGELEVHTSWFPGTAWQFAHCGGCSAQVGWAYVHLRAADPQRFVGLMVDCIDER